MDSLTGWAPHYYRLALQSEECIVLMIIVDNDIDDDGRDDKTMITIDSWFGNKDGFYCDSIFISYRVVLLSGKRYWVSQMFKNGLSMWLRKQIVSVVASMSFVLSSVGEIFHVLWDHA